jgi:hypothetical protein
MATKPVYENEPINNLTFAAGSVVLSGSATVAAASGSNQASGTPITASNNGVTVGSANYSVTMPPAIPGLEIDVLNLNASNNLRVYPSASDNAGTGGTINAGSANAVYSMAGGTSTTFICLSAGAWYTNPRVAS